jgi:hypothetical protein
MEVRLEMKLGLYTVGVLFTFLCVVGYAQQTELLKFRGAYVGQPISDYVDCSSRHAKTLQEGWKTHGDICRGKRGWIFHTKGKLVGLVPKLEGESFVIENEKIATIKLYVPNEDWEKVRYDLIQKMGQPASEVPEVYQNGFGARWEFSRGFWSTGNVVVAAGVKVESVGGVAMSGPFSNAPQTRGIEVTITDAEHAKLPSTRPSTVD